MLKMKPISTIKHVFITTYNPKVPCSFVISERRSIWVHFFFFSYFSLQKILSINHWFSLFEMLALGSDRVGSAFTLNHGVGSGASDNSFEIEDVVSRV